MNHSLPWMLPLLCAAQLSLFTNAQDPAARVRQHHARGHVGAQARPDGVVHAEGPTWQADFSAQHTRFEAEAGPDGDQIAALALRYVGARRGGARTSATADAGPQLAGDEVRKYHDSVIENWLLRARGIEQTFVFAQPPAGSGDLVLEIAVTGNVWAPATETVRHQPLEFRFADQRAIRYGEAFAVDRHGVRIEIATRYDGQGHIELIVPDDFVTGASYPLTIDPVVGAVLLPGATANNDTEPDVAHDVENDRFLVVWRRTFTTSNGIRGALYAGDGTVVTSFIDIENLVGVQAPAVAFVRTLNQDMFFVVWQEPSGIRGRLVDAATGLPPAAAITISNPAAGEVDRRPAVSGPDGAIMVAWDRTSAGQSQPQHILLRDIYWLSPFDPTLISRGPERTLQTVVSGQVSNVRLARSNVAQSVSGVTWYANRAVWQQFFTLPAPGDHDLNTMSFRMKRAPFDFVVIDPLGFVTGAADIGPEEQLADIGSRASQWLDPIDTQFLISYQDVQDVRAITYDLFGATSANFPVRDTSVFEGAPAVGAGACEYTVAYLEITPPNEFDVDIYAARVLPDGTVPESHSLVDNPGSQFQSGVRASSRPILTSAQDERNVSLLAWLGMTGPVGTGLNDIRARFFEPVAPFSSFFGSACPGPLGELPTIGWTGGDPVPGNDAYAITLTNAPANSLAVLLVGGGLVNVPIPGAPGCNLYANLPLIFMLGAITDGAGNAVVALPIPCSMPVSAPVAMQWGIHTPGWNAFGWIMSNDLDVTWFD